MHARQSGAAGSSRRLVTGLVMALLLAGGGRAAADGADHARVAAAAARDRAPAAVAQTAEGYAPKAHIISFGLWGLQNVFRTEANQAAAVLRAYYGRGGQVVVRANARNSGGVTAATLQSALRSVAAQMNKDDDLLVLVLTTHGSPQGLAIKYGQHTEMLTPSQLRQYLAETGAANKIVILSACYSGIFVPLADAHTLVVTAADATHSSFGCSDRAHMTFFGELFFNGSVPQRPTLPEAFALARGQIHQLENDICPDREKLAAGICHSNPQIAGGEAFAERLRADSVSPTVKTKLQFGESRRKFCRQAGLPARLPVCKRPS